MTIGELKKIIEENNIPDDVKMMSDSGWECCATEMDGIYYNAERKLIVFTQHCDRYESYDPRGQNKYTSSEYTGFIALVKGSGSLAEG